MCDWIFPLVISGGCYGFADTLCDIVIHQDEGKKDGKTVHYDELNDTSISDVSIGPSSDAQPKSPVLKSPGLKSKEVHQLSGIQTVFICTLVTYIAVAIYFYFIMWNHESYLEWIGGKSFIFQEKYDGKFYNALLGGVFSFLCYFYVLKAFESAPSTVILPLLQFPSIFIFILSSATKYFQGLVWLERKIHVVAYVFIFLGGLIPATNGNIKMIASKSFWKQPFVRDALVSEICHGLYNMCISSVEDEIEGMGMYIEFFAITRVMFVLGFVVILIFSKKWQDEVWRIKFVEGKVILITVFAEVLTLTAYFNSAMAYQCYYQTGVVTAAESSLNQLLNLFSAYVLRRFFSLGRDESAKGVGNKLLSALLILIGLLLAA